MRSSLSAALTLCALAGCSQAAGPVPQRTDEPVDAVRVAIPAPASPGAVRPPGAMPAWTASPAAAAFGYPGEPPLLLVACRSGQLLVTRGAPADRGAQALFALIGNGQVVRLPVDAVRLPGQPYPVWQGTLAAADPSAAVFAGAAIEATLPGAGRIEVPGGPIPRAVIADCAAPR